MSNTIYHNHHIIPKHMGGSDDKENLIKLTVEEHAEAHRKLYEEFGLEEDRLAWKGLSGEISKKEITRQGRILGGKKGSSSPNNPFKNPEWQKNNNLFYDDGFQIKAREFARTPEAIEKKKKKFKEIKHQEGENNSMYGKRWIHSLIEKRSTRINKNDPLPEDWLEGRKMKFVEA